MTEQMSRQDIVFYTLPTSIPSFTVAIDLPSDLQQSQITNICDSKTKFDAGKSEITVKPRQLKIQYSYLICDSKTKINADKA